MANVADCCTRPGNCGCSYLRRRHIILGRAGCPTDGACPDCTHFDCPLACHTHEDSYFHLYAYGYARANPHANRHAHSHPDADAHAYAYQYAHRR